MNNPQIYPEWPYRYRMLKNGPKGVTTWSDFYWLHKAQRASEAHVAQAAEDQQPQCDFYTVTYNSWGAVVHESNPYRGD